MDHINDKQMMDITYHHRPIPLIYCLMLYLGSQGRILNEILVKATNESKRIIYLGDGRGDFCPSLKLREGDCVLPRKG